MKGNKNEAVFPFFSLMMSNDDPARQEFYMQTITATFENGMLKPAQPLDLPAHAEVRVTIELLPASPLTVGKLNVFLRNLPALGEDAEEFARAVRAVRAELPTEANPWD